MKGENKEGESGSRRDKREEESKGGRSIRSFRENERKRAVEKENILFG